MPGPLADAIRDGEVAGLILFRDNLGGSWSAARALTDEVRRLVPRGRPFLLSIDEEGGLISQLSRLALPGGDAWGAIPTPRSLGRISDPRAARAVGRLIGRRLRSLGITLDYAPSLDLDTEVENPVIGSRSFGADPGLAAEFGVAFAAGLGDAGVMACFKHFPGHGGTRGDSHRELPVMPAGAFELHARPFRTALAGSSGRAGWKRTPWVMSAHVAWRRGRPASLDAELLARVGRWNRAALRVTDALEMKALRSVEWAAGNALAAGNDVLLVGRDWEAGLAAMRALAGKPALRPAARRAERRAHTEWEQGARLARHLPLPTMVSSAAEEARLASLHRLAVRWNVPPAALPAGPWIWIVPEGLAPYADLRGWSPRGAGRAAVGRVEWMPEAADAGWIEARFRRLDRETRPVLWVTLFRGSPAADVRARFRRLLGLSNLQAVAHLGDETWPPPSGPGSFPTALTSGPSVEALDALAESVAGVDWGWRCDRDGWYFPVDTGAAGMMRSGSA